MKHFLKRSTNFFANLELSRVNIIEHVVLKEIFLNRLLTTKPSLSKEKRKSKDLAIDHFKATTFLLATDPNRFSGLWEKLRLDMLKGKDNYPSSISRAYGMVNQYETAHKNHMSRRAMNNKGRC